MDDQTIAATTSPESYPEPAPPTEPISPPETPEPEPSEFSDYDAPPMPNGKPSEIAIDENGDVKFSEEFFSDMPEQKAEPAQPRYYTSEELRNIPFEQWEKDRLPEQLREHYDIVSQQLHSRHAQRQIQQRPSTPPMFQAPRTYTPKELSEEAQKLAVQRLGLQDADDFDDYEPEHRAALNMAMNELVQQNQAEQQNYARQNREYQNLQQFNARLAAQPDYREFDSWFAGKLREYKTSPEVINQYIMNYVKQSNGNFAAIQNMIAGWYQEYQQEKRAQKAPRPPMMESTRGQPYETVRGMNMREFSEMNPDDQAAALMRMGFV